MPAVQAEFRRYIGMNFAQVALLERAALVPIVVHVEAGKKMAPVAESLERPAQKRENSNSGRLAAGLTVQIVDHIPNKSELALRSSRGRWDIQSLRHLSQHISLMHPQVFADCH